MVAVSATYMGTKHEAVDSWKANKVQKHCCHSIKYSSHLKCTLWQIMHTFNFWLSHAKFLNAIYHLQGIFHSIIFSWIGLKLNVHI